MNHVSLINDADEIETEQEIDEAVEEPDTEVEEETSEETEPVVEVEPTTMTIELIYSDDNVMDMYKVTRVIEVTDHLYQSALEAWIAGPTEEGLTSLVAPNVEVESVEIIDGVAHVSFSETLLDTQVGSGTEYMLLQQIAMTLKQFGYDQTQVLISGEIHPELFGHIDTSKPIIAENLEDYDTY